MAALTVIGGIGLGLQLYGSIKGAGEQKKAGKAAQQAAESEARLAEYNATVAEQQARDALARGTEEENKFRASVRGFIGTQRAAAASSNVDAGFGSALDAQADTAYYGELDALTIRNDAMREAWGFNVQAYDLRERARIARQTGVYSAQAGRAAATQGYLQAGATALTAAGGYLSNRNAARQANRALANRLIGPIQPIRVGVY